MVFYIISASYLAVSLCLLAMMWALGIKRKKMYASFLGQRKTDEISEEEIGRWNEIQDTSFNQGPWRTVALISMFYHYPGLIVHAFLRIRQLNGFVMFGVSGFSWIGLIYMLAG